MSRYRCGCNKFYTCEECEQKISDINQQYKDGYSLVACRNFFDGNEYHNTTIDEVLERISDLENKLSILEAKYRSEE